MEKADFKDYRNEIVGFFSRHCVPLYVEYEKDKGIRRGVYSAFVISIQEKWFLITAGHCLREIENCQNEGYKIIKMDLVDCIGNNPKHFHSVPFDYKPELSCYMYSDGYDYGVLLIEDYFCSSLKANGIIPLCEDVWDKQPSDPDFYAMLGIPSQISEFTEDEMVISSVLIGVKRNDSLSSEFEKNNAPTLYGQIEIDGFISDIKGMSGGPIFSFKIDEDGKLRYWLCAVQSRWLDGKKLIAACLMKPFASYLKEMLMG